MGVYDILPYGIQVKCWNCEMKTFQFDDEVPPIDGKEHYSIKLEEGGYANINFCSFESITGQPENPIVFDKWGGISKS
jgi:hypothetical protein